MGSSSAGAAAVGVALALASLAAFADEPERRWQLVRGKHWQLAAAVVPAAADVGAGSCPGGMLHVAGAMKVDRPTALGTRSPYGMHTVEELQKTTCVRWINRDYPERCAEFDREKWLRISATLPTREMGFCMDRYEYPNQRGAQPVAMVAWHEAEALCAEQGKRLCDENEWTFACEGEEAMPYPYGYVRDPEACVVDRPWRSYNAKALFPREAPAAGVEIARLWQAAPSGAREGCVSPFGVHDLTGNVDEWTRGVRRGERPSILKGGYWGPVRTRCRPSTRSHDENHVFYQQGFRCCADTPVSATVATAGIAAP